MRAVLYLGRDYGRRTFPADEVADAIGAPRNYLSKTLNTLAKAGLVTSSRGRNGGFSLAIPPEALTLSRVIAVFDDDEPPAARCLLGDRPCNAAVPCAAHKRWMTITAASRRALWTTTVADLLGDSAR